MTWLKTSETPQSNFHLGIFHDILCFHGIFLLGMLTLEFSQAFEHLPLRFDAIHRLTIAVAHLTGQLQRYCGQKRSDLLQIPDLFQCGFRMTNQKRRYTGCQYSSWSFITLFAYYSILFNCWEVTSFLFRFHATIFKIFNVSLF